MFKKILIANRGEIACRIEKTCHRLGIKSIAIGSTADQGALHMKMADKAVVIGPSPARESYLNMAAIIQAAKQSGAEAIHPGYGFLSESAPFAEAVREAGLVFIGPSSKAIRLMGSKQEAKAIAKGASVPIIPGLEAGEDLDVAARRLGYPLLIKATFGGGGKGMRVVQEASEFEVALAACQRESMAAFGDDTVMLEKVIVKSRHVEVQIIGDSHGHAYALSDRDCSLQRRHQKVIEEAPAPHLSADLRRNLHEAAVDIARAVKYEGLGTVEFLVDENENYYFLEMNTRLQVEHPVTEMVLGLDLVEWQLRVADGEALLWEKEDFHPYGHAVEARLYAEDPDRNFLPSTGTITVLDLPFEENIRIDSGLQEGDEITIFYDPMIAKISAWGETRTAALMRLSEALSMTQVRGVKTNLSFLKEMVTHPEMLKTAPDTGFIDRYVPDSIEILTPEEIYMLAALWLQQRGGAGNPLPWAQQDGWRLNAPTHHRFHFADGVDVLLTSLPQGVKVQCGDVIHHALHVSLSDENRIWALIGGQSRHARVSLHDHELHVEHNGVLHRLKLAEAGGAGQASLLKKPLTSAGPIRLTSPMPGRVTAVLVAVNETVKANQPLMILEAMKMEHTIRAPHGGTVEFMGYVAGDIVEDGAELIRLR